jgi:hypothetical protein
MKHIRHCSGPKLLRAMILFLSGTVIAQAQVKIVNMTPNSLSSEHQRDSEPNLAVDPANPTQMAASAFTPDPMNSGSGPIYVSTDGGDTWMLNVVLPGGNSTSDITLRFASASSVLYIGMLRKDNLNLNILRTANLLAPGVLSPLINRSDVDQPYVQAATVIVGFVTGDDRVYVGGNDLNAPGGLTAGHDLSLSAATVPAPAGFNALTLETRSTCGQDGPPIRTAIHPDGTVYALYYRWTVCPSAGTGAGADVVVARDDNWASGATPFTSLIDPSDLKAGFRVVKNIDLPVFHTTLGTQRVGGGQPTIAVDPRDSRHVCIAWAEGYSAPIQALKVRCSTDGGATWSGDLRTIPSATNPALAINSRGTVGFLYQKFVSSGIWETHLERSSNDFATAPTDIILHAFSSGFMNPPQGDLPLGDYLHLMAVGKDFYGVFSGWNRPQSNWFPNGVTYQRFASFTTNKLYADAAMTVIVPPSIDPFFFKVTELAAADDFYVRDWTADPLTGDTGLEPSTNPVFYATSDVWNRRGTLPGSFLNDQPENEDAGNGLGNIGDNWAFARIRRNALPASGSKTVTAHFLISQFGTGNNYVDAGTGPDPTVTFNASDLGPLLTPHYFWHLDSINSTHFCLAVEISEPGDPYVQPSLVVAAPGWPVSALRMINDNNKAQRNMGLSTTPARGVGGRASFYAIAHNAATFTRNMTIRYEATPEVQRRLAGSRVEVIGGRGKPFKSGDTIRLENMQPGENRWIGLDFPAPSGREGEILPVNFYEMVGGIPVNGFAIAARPAPMSRVIRDNLELHRSVYTRLSAGFNLDGSQAEAGEAQKLREQRETTSADYLKFLRAHIPYVEGSLRDLIKSQQADDPFGSAGAVRILGEAIRSGQAERAAVAHTALLNKLDSFLTMRQLSKGDTADIPQNVRWQKDLYTRLPQLSRLPCSPRLAEASRSFIRAYGERKVGNKDYPALIRELSECFSETARTLVKAAPELEKDLDEMRRSLGDLTALQKAHRDYLLKLQSLENDATRPRVKTGKR